MVNLTKITSKVSNDWVAISPKDKRMVSKGKTLKEVLIQAKKLNVNRPIVFKIGKFDSNFAG